MSYQTKFLISLAFTISAETFVLFFLLRWIFKQVELPRLRIVYAGIMASWSTLPYLWFVLPAFIRSYLLYVLVGEISVVLWEGWFYHLFLRIDLRRAMLVSLLANLVSWGLGVPLLRLLS